MNFRSLVVQLEYCNGRSRRPDGFSFSVVVRLEYCNGRSLRPDRFSFSGSTTLVLERPFSAT